MSSKSGPAPRAQAWRAVARCVGRSFVMLARRQVHLPRENVGRVLQFADGSTSRVYRETAVSAAPRQPCILVVAFKLRLVRGRAHRLFEAESLLNTPLFVGFPGFVSKLWCAHDSRGVYRGLYEWDGPARARHYASALWRVLELVSVPGSISYKVVPGLRRDEVLANPARMEAAGAGQAWWRLLSHK
ncbi:hypothetical protein [Pseudarthrobacter sp. L1SW]|uniref:hypothetical protein n=1 Tax=Pseudarthrobacter sp. L1SW TaxID=2851598 RepID=UPI001E2FBD8A|nr:hypothetical protein [Pseudarthrobacter sp. L1SW]UEL27863.1 hypothetical protein KTR40_14920 [Pseudarthrobacter sp. L1SW]